MATIVVKTPTELREQLEEFRNCNSLGASNVAEVRALIDYLQKMINDARHYAKAQHKKKYGFLARWFIRQKPLQHDPFLVELENELLLEIQILANNLNTLLSTPRLDQAIALFYGMQSLCDRYPKQHAVLFSWLQAIVGNSTVPKKRLVAQLWGNKLVLMPVTGATLYKIQPQPKWPSWWFRTHNTLHDFITNESDTLACALAELHARKTPITIAQLLAIDSAIDKLSVATLRVEGKFLNKQGREFISAFVKPVKLQQREWLKEKLTHANELFAKLKTTLLTNYPSTYTHLRHTNPDFKADLMLLTKLCLIIENDRQSLITTNEYLADEYLFDEYNQLHREWQRFRAHNARCVYPSGSNNKQTLLAAMFTDIDYLTSCNAEQSKKQTTALTTLTAVIIEPEHLSSLSANLTPLIKCLFTPRDLDEGKADWLLKEVANLLLPKVDIEVFKRHFPSHIVEQLQQGSTLSELPTPVAAYDSLQVELNLFAAKDGLNNGSSRKVLNPTEKLASLERFDS